MTVLNDILNAFDCILLVESFCYRVSPQAVSTEHKGPKLMTALVLYQILNSVPHCSILGPLIFKFNRLLFS